jgi:hypothetical protein
MVLAVLLMLRVGKLREKYAVLWLVVGGLTIVLGIFPNLLDFAASAVGVRVPANLLFALSIVLLVGVGLHVSRELTILEDETRILAEELAILRSSVARLSAGQPEPLHRHSATETVDQTSNSREERN